MKQYSQKSLEHRFKRFIVDNHLIEPGQKIIVAVSGGMDSVCLFDLLFKLKDDLNIKLSICHFNHRLRGEDSEKDCSFVKKLSEDSGVEFYEGKAKNDNSFSNEEEAREARYKFFEKILEKNGGADPKIAIAHNQNDLIETFLMRLFRGSGIQGLKSIPLRRKNFIRPLLNFNRKEIERYIEDNDLEYVTDKTNFDSKYTRNYIRNEIMPDILRINPNIYETLSNTIKTMEQDSRYLDDITEKKFAEMVIYKDKNTLELDRKKWLSLPRSLRMSTLRLAISNISILKDVTKIQLDEVEEIISKGEGKKYKILPHSLRVCIDSGKIRMLKE